MWTYEELSIWLPPQASRLGRNLPWQSELGRLAWREDGEAYYLEGALRGFRKKDVRVEVRDGQLEVRSERRRGLWHDEQREFQQRVTLPRGADATAIEACFEKGQLSIRVPKLAHARRRIVPVRVNGALPPSPASLAPSAWSPLAWLRQLGSRLRHHVGSVTARFA